MSLKATCKTQISDEADLVAALEGIYGKNKISVVAAGVEVRGYVASNRPTVLVNVDRLIGTAGYYKNAQGQYELVYDSSDRNRLKDLIPHKLSNGSISDRLAQSYAKIRVTKALRSLQNSSVASESTDEKGNIKIKIKINEY